MRKERLESYVPEPAYPPAYQTLALFAPTQQPERRRTPSPIDVHVNVQDRIRQMELQQDTTGTVKVIVICGHLIIFTYILYRYTIE